MSGDGIRRDKGGRDPSGPGASSLRSPEPVPVSAHPGDAPSRVRRPRHLTFRVTEGAYAFLAAEAARQRTTKAAVLRETLNKGQQVRRDELELERMREAIEDLCYQFAHHTTKNKSAALWTGGLSALEDAFDILGWDDPHRTPELTCDEPKCWKHATCGTPTAKGYRRVCGEHFMALACDTDRSGEAGQTAEQAGPEGREPGPERSGGIANA